MKLEEYYSITYGIPQVVFYAKGRNLVFKQEDIKNIYKNIPTALRASMLFNDEMLSIDKPHYSKSGFTFKTVSDRIININYLAGAIRICPKALMRADFKS